jgi:hypothetical protein
VDDASLLVKLLDEVALSLVDPASDQATAGSNRWEDAWKKCRQASDMVERYERRVISRPVFRGLIHMYSGALHHAQGDIFGAINCYGDARNVFFAFDRHNWAVAVFALALVNLRTEQLDQVPEVMDAFAALRVSDSGRVVQTRWETASKSAEQRQSVASISVEDGSAYNEVTMPTQARDPGYQGDTNEEISRGPQWLEHPPDALKILTGIAIIFALFGAIVVFMFGKMPGLIAYAAAFVFAVVSYLLVAAFEQPQQIPAMCAALIEGPGQPMVCEGPTTYRMWPFLQHVRAIIPLHTLSYISPKQKVTVKSDIEIEISLAVQYRVANNNDAENQRANVCRAVYSVIAASDKRDSTEAMSRRSYGPSDLRLAWQKMLLNDIRMVLLQTVPALLSLDGIDRKRTMLEKDIVKLLRNRAIEWGLQVMDVRIAELTKTKA